MAKIVPMNFLALFRPLEVGQYITGTVDTYAQLPDATLSDKELWLVNQTTGVIFINQKEKGFYKSNGVIWDYKGYFPTSASQISNAPSGNISSTNVQAAINELDSEKQPLITSATDLSLNSILFNNTNTTPPATVGQLSYNAGTESLEVKLSNDVTMQIGRESLLYAKNDEGSLITNGKAVYVSGGSGANPHVKLASATNHFVATATIGLATEDLAINQLGNVCTEGYVNDVNTNAWIEGTALYLDTVAGGLTSTVPAHPATTVFMGIVLRQNTNNGRIYVKVIALPNIEELSNVTITTPATGDMLVYNATTSLWENKTKSAANIVSGSGSSGRIPYWSASTTISSDTALLWDATGNIITYPNWKPTANSATALQFFKADGTTVVGAIDTTNSRWGIGGSASTQTLKVTGDFEVEGATFPVASMIRTTTVTGGPLNGLTGIASGYSVRTKTTSDMIDGFGGGIYLTIQDDTSSASYTEGVVGRIFGRRDGADNLGCMQFWTTGVNSAAPTLTLRASGDNEITRGKYSYQKQTIGSDTDGDWRTYSDGSDYYTQKRVSGVWTNKSNPNLGALNDVVISTPLEGQPLVYDTATSKWVNNSAGTAVTKEATGFDTPESVIVTYDSATRIVTLTGTVNAYFRGKKVTALTSGWSSTPHDNTNGNWFLLYDGSNFVWQNTPWTFDQIQIAFISFGVLDKFAIRECHGIMAWQTHTELHNTIGTYRTAGGLLSNYVVNSTVAADRRPFVGSATLNDEDLQTINPALNTNSYSIHYLTGTVTNNFTLAQTDIVPLSGSRPYYNQFTGGAWQQTLMSNNDYSCVWIVAVPVTSDTGSQSYRYIFVQGQTESSSLSNIQALSPSDVNLGNLTNIAPEFVFISKIIIKYTGADWSITSVTNITGTKLGQTSAASLITPPAGLNTEVQYNNAGAFGSSSNFYTDGVNVANLGFSVGKANLVTSGDLTIADNLNYTFIGNSYEVSSADTVEIQGAVGTLTLL